MRQGNTIWLGALAALLMALFAGGSAAACALHALSPRLKISHPKALRVAMATRAALDEGLIAPLPEGDEERRETLLALAQTSNQLTDYANGARLPGPVYSVLFLRSELWLSFNSWGPALYHAPPAAPGETTLVLNESTYAALLEGRLSVQTAVEQGVLAVDGTRSAAATAHFTKLLAGFRESPVDVSARRQ